MKQTLIRLGVDVDNDELVEAEEQLGFLEGGSLQLSRYLAGIDNDELVEAEEQLGFLEGKSLQLSTYLAGKVSATEDNPPAPRTRSRRARPVERSAGKVDDLCFTPAHELAELMATRQLSPLELLDAFVARIDKVNPLVNGIITIDEEGARNAARKLEAELLRGSGRGPLHGIPVAVKDVVYTAGLRTTMGSRIYSQFVPAEDAAVVRALREAGLVILGKANTHEFAFGATNNNPHFGPCSNPWDIRRVSGGSSGGSAASVSAGLCGIAIGTDTGGSIRIPGALCGTVGLRPTYGVVGNQGVFPVAWSLDEVGPLTRTVYDATLALQVMASTGTQSNATYLASLNPARCLTGDIRGLRVGVVAEHLSEPIAPDIRALFDEAVGNLRELGARVEIVSIPAATVAPYANELVTAVEAAFVHRDLLRRYFREYGEDVRRRLLAGFAVGGVDYFMAQQARRVMRSQTAEVLRKVDVLVGPTVPFAAPRIGERSVGIGKSRNLVWRHLVRFTRLSSATGLPALTVPCGFSADGLPAGISFLGRAFEESTILRAAHAYERAAGSSPIPVVTRN